MSERDVSGLLAELKASLEAAIGAVRAFGNALRARARKPPADSGPFGDTEKIEAAKYHSPQPSRLPAAEDGELPESYGRNKVVLLAVDPYLVHAYWDFDAKTLPGTDLQRTPRVPAVLRFYETTEGLPPSRFDVEVDLEARNWYVHLWSPAKRYYVELGVTGEGHAFIPLARSNSFQTPRAWPAAQIEEPPIEARAEQQRVEGHAPHPPEAVPTQVPAPVETRNQVTSAEGAETMLAGGGREGCEAERSLAPVIPRPVDAAEVLRERLSALYALRQSPPRQAAPAPGLREVPAEPGPNPHEDLTTITEQRFSPGLSSGVLGPPEHGSPKE